MNQEKVNEITILSLQCFLMGKRGCFQLKQDECRAVFPLASKHDIAHLIGAALEAEGQTEGLPPFQQEARKAMYRFAKQEYERERIYALFEREAIPFIPLKGSVIYKLYPKPWHRTSCDIDILVPERELDRAEEVLERELGYTFHKRSEHDLSLMAPGGVHLELHYDFHEPEMSVEMAWADAVPDREGGMRRGMSPELTIFYHIAHMAKHFKYGGCGLRSFVDLWLLKHKLAHDPVRLGEMLEESGLRPFADAAGQLAEVWFGTGEPTSLTEAMAEYILPAGAYGSLENRVAMGQIRQRGKSRYFLARLFLPYETLKYAYPELEKHRWLMPVCQVRRWMRLLRSGKLEHIRSELQTNREMDSGYREDVRALMHELQLE